MKKLSEWWRWTRRVDWVLVDVIPTTYSGNLPTQLCPYFWERWIDKRTGEERIVACT